MDSIFLGHDLWLVTILDWISSSILSLTQSSIRLDPWCDRPLNGLDLRLDVILEWTRSSIGLILTGLDLRLDSILDWIDLRLDSILEEIVPWVDSIFYRIYPYWTRSSIGLILDWIDLRLDSIFDEIRPLIGLDLWLIWHQHSLVLSVLRRFYLNAYLRRFAIKQWKLISDGRLFKQNNGERKENSHDEEILGDHAKFKIHKLINLFKNPWKISFWRKKRWASCGWAIHFSW